MSTKATYNIFYCFTRTTTSKTNHFTIQIRPEQDQNKIQRSNVPSTQPSDMELVSQYYERPKKYKRKFTPTKPINQKRSRPKLNFLLLSKLVLSLGVSPVYYLSADQIPDLQFVGVPEGLKLNKEPLWPHVPLRINKRKFKPKIPANRRSRRKITQ
ncbi:hypothetical protein BDB01DRAFT_910121 [Pilobolus umbonatus]|nr:hypothetical protein BDB01DRAFT_910121 [Pilobolus umbonatus]